MYHSTLGWRVMKKKKKRVQPFGGEGGAWRQPHPSDSSRLAAIHAPACIVRVQGSGFGVQGPGFRVQGLGFRVQGSGFRVQGSGDPSDSSRLATARAPACIPQPPISTHNFYNHRTQHEARPTLLEACSPVLFLLFSFTLKPRVE